MTGADPIERLIQQADLIGANARHGAQRRQEVADRAARDRHEAGRLAALAFVAMYQEQQEGAQRLADRLRRIRTAAYRRTGSGFMRAWSKHEHAPRTTCPTCHFESSEGYPPSHSDDCDSDDPAHTDGAS